MKLPVHKYVPHDVQSNLFDFRELKLTLLPRIVALASSPGHLGTRVNALMALSQVFNLFDRCRTYGTLHCRPFLMRACCLLSDTVSHVLTAVEETLRGHTPRTPSLIMCCTGGFAALG